MTKTTKRHEVQVDERIAAASQRVARLANQLAGYEKTIAKYGRLAAGYDAEERMAKLDADLAVAARELTAANRQYKGWSRFFIVQGGHIHSTMSCSTCNNGKHPTDFGWLPQLSGLTEADAVAEHGAILCTVCFPSAPVHWTNKYELEAAAKAASKCPGQRDYSKPSRQGYYTGNWATCDTCGGRITITSTGKLRAHKPEGK